jgi:hypothetical protein
MARQLKGVGGVLGGLITESSEQATAPTPPQEGPQPEPAEPPPEISDSTGRTQGAGIADRVTRAKDEGPSEKPRVRRGRPPKRAGGATPGEAVQREKVTLRLDANLMNQYRDWTWERRCQLHDLIEEAMAQYLKRHQGRAVT